jgi:hypothetical protein
MRVDARMFVHVTIRVHVRRALTVIMNMKDAQDVDFVGKTWRHSRSVAKRKGDARRQYAKHIDQGEEPPSS